MARRGLDRRELLLEVLRLLETRPMAAEDVPAAVDRQVGPGHDVRPRDVGLAIAALEAEGLVEVAAPDAPSVYRITSEGAESVAQRASAVAPRVERVAMLFTDVVGSTALLERLGDDLAHGLRREHFALLRREIREHRGHEVKSLGDGLMVAFSGPRDALRCGLAMQDAVAERDGGLQLRIGVAWGEATREDGDYFGRPVIVARRLCDAAGAGDVLAPDPVPALAALSGAPRAKPVGPLALKGLSEPIAASVLRPRALAQSA